ncbi:TPA: iron ABC transporter permease, partial [Vibrio vulnificus]|nr:iron ABC transporter permease [Vibrio vulnificus]
MKEKKYTWKTSSGALALLLVLPILAIFYTAVGYSDELFAHLMSTVMPSYILNTILLTTGVLVVSLILGIPSAWFMAMCKLPTEKWLQWALVLP